MDDARARAATGPDTYARGARLFHWVTAAFVFIMVPVGIYMVRRGEATNFDALTNTLYSNHKLAGFILLWIVAARLAYRFAKGAPADEPTLDAWQKTCSHTVHWGMYALLLIVPMLGWIGVSLYPALGVPGGFNLPALTSPNDKLAGSVLFWHGFLAITLAGAVAVHIGAALFHHFIRKDNVLRRMLPKLPKR